MNSTWNKNLALFKERFPLLFSMIASSLHRYETESFFPFEIIPAKNGSPTAIEKQKPLHSKYNPEHEAELLIKDFSEKQKACAVFLGMGLGYAPLALARKNPEATIIIVEPDEIFFLHALSALNLEDFFRHTKINLLLGDNKDVFLSLIKNFSSEEIQVFCNPAQTSHAQDYFDSVKKILSQNSQKEEINTNTLERFSSLWLRNSCRNLRSIEKLSGIKRFENKGSNLPFLILGAGPSLGTLLPYLSELKKKAVIVCVDTALHACLSLGVEPDFILLIDPQYAASLHLEFLSSPSSFLITECAVWQSVLRFCCKEIVLCSSQFPIGSFFEKRIGYKGKLAAGGSVATSAWDFARFCGAKEIFLAGMDLGFPNKQTHIRGSQFEERSHRTSTRTHTAENDNAASLFSAQPNVVKDFLGNNLPSDKRMELFAWWFSNQCPKEKKLGVNTYTLTPQSHALEGVEIAQKEDLLSRPDISEKKEVFLCTQEISSEEKISFEEALESFKEDLSTLEKLARKGIQSAEKGIRDSSKISEVISELDSTDKSIMNSSAKEAASLIFPTQRQLEKLSQNLPQDEKRKPLYYSRLIYTELLGAIKKYKEALETIL